MRYDRVTVTQEHGLTREVYTFWFDDYKNQLVLDEYRKEYKETPRHKWKNGNVWSRLNHRGSNNMKRESIFVPEDIKQMALNEFIRRITIE